MSVTIINRIKDKYCNDRCTLSSVTPGSYQTSLSTASLPVDVVLNAQQVVGHGLQRELMQKRRHRVKATIQNDQLSARLVWTLETSEQKENTTHTVEDWQMFVLFTCISSFSLIILLTTDFGYTHSFPSFKKYNIAAIEWIHQISEISVIMNNEKCLSLNLMTIYWSIWKSLLTNKGADPPSTEFKT